MVRPNPKYDPVTGAVTIPTTPKEPRPNPRYGAPVDIFVNIDGYSRNLVLEEKLERESKQVSEEISHLGEFNPLVYPVPSWWERVAKDINQDPADAGQGYGHYITTHQQALDYLKLSQRYYQAKINLFNYQCSNYPKDPVFCQHSAQFSGTLGKINSLIPLVQKRIVGFQFQEILPQVFAEEEPVPAPTPEPVTAPTPEPVTAPMIHGIPTFDNESITDNMITQKIDYFTIENGRAIGQITFTATQNFNPFWYNKTIANIIQFKDRNGANILPTVKQNTLRFTATERTETIQYNEGMQDNIYSKVSSFVWSSARTPTAFSKQSEFEIREKEPVKPISSGFMAAGVVGAIAGLVLLGFIVDSKVGK